MVFWGRTVGILGANYGILAFRCDEAGFDWCRELVFWGQTIGSLGATIWFSCQETTTIITRGVVLGLVTFYYRTGLCMTCISLFMLKDWSAISQQSQPSRLYTRRLNALEFWWSVHFPFSLF